MIGLPWLGTLLPACLALAACGPTNRAATAGSGSGPGVFGASFTAADGGSADPYSGPFRILVLSKTLGYHHDSIPAGQQMLRELGGCVDAPSCALTNDVPIAGAKPNSPFTVDVAGAPASGCPAIASSGPNANDDGYAVYSTMGCDGSTSDLSQFTPENLENYQMIFFVSPTGTVFSSGGDNGQIGMAAIQAFIDGGGAYGGVHAASDFEDTDGWPWYYDELMGAHFQDHNDDGTPGTVITAPAYLMHPVMRGLPTPLSTEDEWYLENREISAQPGFQILATLSDVPPLSGESASDVRPMIWIKQFPVATDPTATLEGRMFYTCRGHNIARYGEAPFRQLIHQGILWATHRMN
jgi:type 1 glutamine amidotransferase